MAGYGELFFSFFKIGSFTLGGGYAMIPLMERELVESKHWLTSQEFLDVLSLSQAMPGIFAVNMATNVGYRLRGLRGALTAVVGNILVPVLLILLLAMFFRAFRQIHWVECVFKGIRPAVVALIAAPVFRTAQTAHITWRNAWIPVVSALMIWLLGISPVFVIMLAIAGGFVYGRIKDRKKLKQ